MSAWVLGGALALLTVSVGLPYIWFVRRRGNATVAGLHALAGLRWREFATLVGQAMQQRGLRHGGRDGDDPGGDGHGSRLVMTDGSQRWLLSCKHGLAYHLGDNHVRELAEEMEAAGARHGILLTEGRVRARALASAARHGVEVIDGRRLWPLLRPYLSTELRSQVEAGADRRARLESVVAVLAALLLGVATALWGPALGQSLAGTLAARREAAAAVPAQPPTEATREPALPAVSGPLPEDADIEAFPDDETLQFYRSEVVRAVSLQPGIGRTHWMTHNTLVVERTGSIDAIWPLICAELERYPALRTVRVQLNPRPGRDEQVRWRQCRTQ